MTPPSVAISVLVPSFNAGRHLDAALASVVPQLGTHDEVLVQDGGSTDESITRVAAAYTDEPRVKIVSEPDDGQSDALRRALGRAANPFIGWLNADDLYYPGALDALRRAVAEEPDAAIVYGTLTMLTGDDHVLRTIVPGAFTVAEFLRHGCHVFSGAAFLRAETVRRVGGFDPSLHYCMDFDLFLRLAEIGARAIQVPETLGGYRWHDESKSSGRTGGFVREAWQIRLRHAPGLVGWVRVVAYTAAGFAVLWTRPLRHSRLYSWIRRTRRF